MTLDYFYGQTGELFSFYRIPKALFQEQRFQSLSTDAKTLYGILLDRMSLSAKNGWLDEQGRVFIIFTIEDVKRSLCCADNKATKLLRELEEFGLIERKRRGLGRPSLVYVKNFSADSSKARFQNRENHESGGFKSTSQDPAKPRCNKTDSDGSGQQFITLVSKSGNTFYLVIDRNAKGQQTVHFMNLVDESDLLALMEDEDADAYTAEKEAAAQAELERKQAEEDAKKAEEEAAASGTEQPKENKITKYAATFLGMIALVALAAGGGFYAFMKQKQKKQAEKEALDPDADYTEDKGDFEIPVEDVFSVR